MQRTYIVTARETTVEIIKLVVQAESREEARDLVNTGSVFSSSDDPRIYGSESLESNEIEALAAVEEDKPLASEALAPRGADGQVFGLLF
jgi:hypothetical protein